MPAGGSLHHDILAGGHAGQDLDPAVTGADPELERPDARLVAFDDESHEAALAGQDGALGHHHRVGARLRGQVHFREEPGLEDAGVLHPGHDLDLPRGRIRHFTHVVDLSRERRVAEGRDLEGDGLAGARAQGLALRDLEAQAQPAGVHERGQDVSRLHELARLHRLRIDDPAVGRAHLRPAEVLQRDVPRRLGGVGLRGQAVGLAPRAVQLLDGHQLLLGQLLAPQLVLLGAAAVHQRLLEARFRALHLQAVTIGVDAEEHGLRPDAHPFVEAHVRDHAFHLGRHLHDLLGLEAAHGLDLVGHVAGADGLDLDRDRAAAGGSGCPLGRLGAAAGRGGEEHGRRPDECRRVLCQTAILIPPPGLSKSHELRPCKTL